MGKLAATGLAGLLAMALAPSVQAQDAEAVAAFVGADVPGRFVTANDPAGMLQVLKDSGYEVELGTDGAGDPQINIQVNGWNSFIYFYGCAEETHDGCDAIQLSTGFDRKKPMDPAAALSISKRYRYLAVYLDDEGDPYLQWDILTGDALPQGLFLRAVRNYGDVLDGAAQIIFEGEE